jgi:hypothetical protein
VQCAVISDRYAADVTEMYREFAHIFPKEKDLVFVLSHDLVQESDRHAPRDKCFRFPSEICKETSSTSLHKVAWSQDGGATILTVKLYHVSSFLFYECVAMYLVSLL